MIPDGMDIAAPRRAAGEWQDAHPFAGRAAPWLCCAWSNFTLKLSPNLVGKAFMGGGMDARLVWQSPHMGACGLTNWARWQLVHELCPGKRGVFELSLR